MSFQTDDLSMLVLGILGDKPPDAEQPPLRDGIHCRWQFTPERELPGLFVVSPPKRGFPWYGYYLFRRETQVRKPRCLSEILVGLQPGFSVGTRLETRLGRLSGAAPLVLREEFP